MSIDLKNFVDINIQKAISSQIVGSRDTCALFTQATIGTGDVTSHIYASYEEATSGTYQITDTNTLAYLNMYFANGGIKVCVITIASALTKADITALDNTFICVASVGTTYAQMKALAIEMNTDTTIYGINEKLLLTSFIDTDYADSNNTILAKNDTDLVKNFIAKYAGNVYYLNVSTPVYQVGFEMTIAAYLSRINVYGIDTVHDYMYTEEVIALPMQNFLNDISDSDYKSLIAKNFNLDIYLSDGIRDCGGNCKNGNEIVNEYTRIILHQTLTARLIQLLTQKIKSSTGISKMYAVISNELDRYLTSGYLTTDKIYTDDDWTVTANDTEYVIVEKDTPIDHGYIIKILPVQAIQNKNLKEAPPIFVLLADQYGIRKITVDGKVI